MRAYVLMYTDSMYKCMRGPRLGSLLRFPLGGSTAIKVFCDKTRQIVRYFEEALPRTRYSPLAWQRPRQERIFPAKCRMFATVILFVRFLRQHSDLYQRCYESSKTFRRTFYTAAIKFNALNNCTFLYLCYLGLICISINIYKLFEINNLSLVIYKS